jgi:glyoxylase-like metal-dependent hydrolase (beta-lactamase superfamily II)
MTLDRRSFLQISAAGLCAAALPLPIHAKIQQGRQVPAYYRLTVGDIEVTALSDGMLELDASLYPQADKAEAEQLLQAAHRSPKIPTAVNAYIASFGDTVVLIDTGTSNVLGPTLGKVPANMTAAGFDASAVDVVFITHLHPDHAAGLIDSSGKPAYPNAELVLTEKEYAFWHDDGILEQAPAAMKPFFEGARAAVKPYASRMRKITDGEIVPGLAALPAPGHTPGHTMVRISSGNDTLLVWGDIVHTASLQLPHPEWAISFDTDPNTAIATRKAVYDQVAADGAMIAGMHLDFPGIGHISKTKTGYDYHPVFWSTTL